MSRSFDIAQLNIADLEITQLLEACQGSRLVCFDDGDFIIEENKVGTEIYLALRGAFTVEQNSGHTEQDAAPTIIASLCVDIDSPCFVGEMAYFGGGFRSASVRSSGATYTIELHPEHLEIILDKFPTFTRILCQQFTTRLKEANDELKQISAVNALRAEQLLVDEGDVIIQQGDSADKLYSLVFGTLRWEQDGQTIGGSMIQEFIEPGAYFSDGSYSVTVRATAPSCLAVIDKSSKEAVVRNYPQLALELLSQS